MHGVVNVTLLRRYSWNQAVRALDVAIQSRESRKSTARPCYRWDADYSVVCVCLYFVCGEDGGRACHMTDLCPDAVAVDVAAVGVGVGARVAFPALHGVMESAVSGRCSPSRNSGYLSIASPGWTQGVEATLTRWISTARVNAVANELAALAMAWQANVFLVVMSILTVCAAGSGVQGLFEVWRGAGPVDVGSAVAAGSAAALAVVTAIYTNLGIPTKRDQFKQRSIQFKNLARRMEMEMAVSTDLRNDAHDILLQAATWSFGFDKEGDVLPVSYRRRAATRLFGTLHASYDATLETEGDTGALRVPPGESESSRTFRGVPPDTASALQSLVGV